MLSLTVGTKCRFHQLLVGYCPASRHMVQDRPEVKRSWGEKEATALSMVGTWKSLAVSGLTHMDAWDRYIVHSRAWLKPQVIKAKL